MKSMAPKKLVLMLRSGKLRRRISQAIVSTVFLLTFDNQKKQRPQVQGALINVDGLTQTSAWRNSAARTKSNPVYIIGPLQKRIMSPKSVGLDLPYPGHRT